jgi:hypothetical protein
MPAKYSEGSRVKIKITERDGRSLLQVIEGYENQTGKVLSSKAVVAYTLRSLMAEVHDTPATTLYLYNVKLEDGDTLFDVMEFYLEAI